MMIVRGDDFGITHSCNLAIQECFNNGILTCAGLMAPAPWAEEAATMARANPHWCIGVHLTTIGEWKGYRLRPVLPYNEVKSLTDEHGFLHQSPKGLYSRRIDPDQLEQEFMAQVDLLTNHWGIDLGYLDYHYTSGHEISCPEYREVSERVANLYDLPISYSCGETTFQSIFDIEPDQKTDHFLAGLEKKTESGLWISVHHLLQDDSESRALKYSDPDDEPEAGVAAHRIAEAAVLTDPFVKKQIDECGIKLISYRDREYFPINN